MDLLLKLDTTENQCLPLYKQLAAAIREAILDGRLKPGQPVPSTRRLAVLADVCRATVVKAYEDLVCEGFITSDASRGSFVSDPLPLAVSEQVRADSSNISITFSPSMPQSELSDEPFEASDFVNRIDSYASQYAAPPHRIDPSLARRWKQLTLKQCKLGTLSKLSSADNQKKRTAHLKSALSSYLFRSRAIQCSNEQLFLGCGKEFLLYLVCRFLLSKDDKVVVGSGCPPQVRAIFEAQGAQLAECPVDREGPDFDHIRASSWQEEQKPRVIYVNPSAHQPTGEVMTLSRRLQLLAYAEEIGAYVLEDDIDSEFRYGNQALPAVHRLSKCDNVFYLSSLSDLLAPLANVSLLVVPRKYSSHFAFLTTEEDISAITSAVVSGFIEDGHLEQYIKQKRQHNARLKQKLTYCLTRQMLRSAKIVTQSASSRQVLRIDSPVSVPELMRFADACGLHLEDLGHFYSGGSRHKDVSLSLEQVEDDSFDKKIETFASWIFENSDLHGVQV